MLIHNADITGSLTINGIPYNSGSFSGSFQGDGSRLTGIASYTDADTLFFIQGYSGSYSGSFFGDGSNLTGVTSYTDADTLDFINSLNVVSGSIQTLSTVSDTFTSVTSYTVTHNFGTKQVIVSVYENDTLIFPSSINTPTTNTVTITFPEPVTGRVVVVKAGHVVSGSINYTSVLNKPTLVSGSSQISFTGITNKPTLISGSSQVSFTGITNKPTLISGSAQIAALGYATTGSNTFQGNQTITGSLFITQNLVVAGSSSIQYISSSVVDIADNIITVNAFNPGVRFGGLAVADSGSSPRVSGSLIFDSIKDQWIFVHQNQSVVTSSVLLMGPEVYDNIGNETYLSANRLPKGSGVEHLKDSNITDTGTVVSVNSNTQVTGSLGVTGSLTVAGVGVNSGIRVGSTDGGRVFIRQSAGGDAEIGAITNGGLFLYANNTLGLSFTGAAATFASSVTTNNLGFIATNGYGITSYSGATASGNNIVFGASVYNTFDGIYQSSGTTRDFGIWLNGGTINDPKFVIKNGGNVGIGTTSPSSLLEVAGGGIFSLQLSGNLTNSTRKFAFIQGKHYTNSEEPIAMIGIDSQASTSVLYIGGGLSSELNAATEISFQTGATNTTLTGTERLRIASGGLVTVTGTGAGSTSEGVFFKRTSNLAQGGYISGNGGVFNIVATDEQNSNNGNIYFQRYNGTTVSNSMVINSNGVVLINNTYASPNGVLNTFKTPVNSTYVDQIVVQGTGNYPSLRLGTYDAYDGVIATTGNDLRILAGLDVYTENHSIRFYTSFIGGTGGAQAYERMRIESDGVVQVRSGNELRAYRPDNARYGTFYTDNNNVVIAASVDPITLSSPERIVFSTAGTERMRINSGGYLKASNNAVYESASGGYHEFNQSNSGSTVLIATHRASDPYGIELQFKGADPNNASNYVFGAYTTSGSFAWIYRIFSNGTVSARSDARWKKNIETTRNGYIDDLCKLRVVKYNWYNHEDDAPKELGLIAQEVEEVFPNLIQHDTVTSKKQVKQEDGTFVEEEFEDGTSRSIKVSVLPYMLLKAIQEQQKQIEELKIENDNLKSRLEVLEQS
jgi:hypothetical protein